MENLDSTPSDTNLRRAFNIDHEAPEEIRDRSKVKIAKDSILLSGDATFYTIQGEGPTLGMPCVFCRLHNCNLRCSWCDAYYTWFEESVEFWTEPKRVSFEECARMIEDKWVTGNPRVIFSGGEPLIQKKQIDQVVNELYKGFTIKDPYSWSVEIETNGTLMPTDKGLKHYQFNCSPKLRNSDNKEYAMVKPRCLQALDKGHTTFKFVCKSEEDLQEIEERYLEHISYDKIIIMPEGIVEEEITAHARALYEPCLKRGWRMTPRFQAIFADGARRGV